MRNRILFALDLFSAVGLGLGVLLIAVAMILGSWLGMGLFADIAWAGIGLSCAAFGSTILTEALAYPPFKRKRDDHD